jgi:hypothetical protein
MSKEGLIIPDNWMVKMKRAYKAMNKSQWEIADLVLQVAPQLGEGEKYDNGQTIQTRLRYLSVTLAAEDIDLASKSLAAYRGAAIAFPPESEGRKLGVWPAHRLQAQPDREELVAGHVWTDPEAIEFVKIRNQRDSDATREQFQEFQEKVKADRKKSPKLQAGKSQLLQSFWPLEEEEPESPDESLINYRQVVEKAIKQFRRELKEFGELLQITGELPDDEVNRVVNETRAFQKTFSQIQMAFNQEQAIRLQRQREDDTGHEAVSA